MLYRIDSPIIAAIFGALMYAAWFLGSVRGRKLSLDPNTDPGSKVADATVALLGLLLAFTFAMTLERHELRRSLVVEHANAIGDLYTCATLIPDPERSALQAALRDYAAHELKAVEEYLSEEDRRKVIAETMKMHNGITETVGRAIARGTPIAVNTTTSLNDVTSAHSSRTSAYEVRIPWPVQMLLLVTACASAFLVGRQQGLASKKCLSGTLSFILLVTLVIFVIKDLGQPRRGLIRANYDSMERVIESMKP